MMKIKIATLSLENFGRSYIRTLDGYPLAINVVSSLLYGQMSYEAWKQIVSAIKP